MKEVAIDDPADPRLVDFIGLRDRDLRTRADGSHPQAAVFVAEGDIVVERALLAGHTLRSLLIDAARTAPLPAGVAESGCEVYRAGRDVVQRITGMAVHRGSMGVFLRPPPLAASSVIDNAERLVLMEAVVNPINLGLIARSAAAFGMDGLLLDGASVDPLYRRSSRVSMGEVFALPFATVPDLTETIGDLTALGFLTVALTPGDDAVDLVELSLADHPRVALLLGSEGPGLKPDTAAACSRRGRIPITDRVDSLNVGVAAGIALYEATRSPRSAG